MNEKICTSPIFTLRVLNREEVNEAAITVVQRTLLFACSELKIPPHIFVTIVPGDAVKSANDIGFACYLSGQQQIFIPGIMPVPIDEEFDFNDWLRFLAESTVHELVHYIQELEGRLKEDCEEECEDEANRIATETIEKFNTAYLAKNFFENIEEITDRIENDAIVDL